jgi:CRISPR system Cascade subunit CasD
VDREGLVRYDYHTAKDVRIAEAEKVDIQKKTGVRDSVSRRYYLADACFLVGLEGEDLALLQRLHEALENPVWPLFLGRKAFVPAEPPYLPDGLRLNTDLETALKTYPPLTARLSSKQARLVVEDVNGYLVRPDQPLSFAQRRFAPRRLTVRFMTWPTSLLENQQSVTKNQEAA